VTSATLVYWEEIGLLRPARTRLGRRRMYFPADLDRIRQIKWLRYSELLTLEGVKRRLEAPRDQEVYDWPVRSRGMTIDDSKGPADAPSLAP
jgi:DNA-binding transcriptional MerR regulator